jgi:hypothetical protein
MEQLAEAERGNGAYVENDPEDDMDMNDLGTDDSQAA